MNNFSRYTFNEDGEIYSSRGKLLCSHRCKKGYCRVNLKNDSGKKRTYLVHRLIATKYLPNPDNLPQVNHIDGNKSNNAISNLEWCTAVHNVRHSVETGLVKRGDKRPNAKLTEEQVRQLRSLRHDGLNYYQLGRFFGIAYQTAHKICTGQTYTHVK